jgi:Type I phosphodiesterase / nucleotide pyrophosphatase
MFHLSMSKMVLALISTLSASFLLSVQLAQATPAKTFKHVLILSVDGLRSADLQDPALKAYIPNILKLQGMGVTYPNAFTSSPSDSFPGTLSWLTGAGPATTGVYYDDSYARNLTNPIVPFNGEATGNARSPRGAEATFFEAIDYSIPATPAQPDPTNVLWRLDGGGYPGGDPTKPLVKGNYGKGSIDVTRLPQNCTSGTCKPVYPWQYIKSGVNTVFNVVHNAGLYTAYSDKHAAAYNIVQGPGGNSIDDYYSPEINASVLLNSNGKHR